MRFSTPVRREGTGPFLVSSQIAYESWPVLARAKDGSIVCCYAAGSTHMPVDTARKAVSRRCIGTSLRTWQSEVTILDTASQDDSVFGLSTDDQGDLLVWVLVRTSPGTVYSHKVYKSSDSGASWSSHASPTFSPNPVNIGPGVNVSGVGIFCHWHAGTESGEASNSHGVLKSTDGGATWTQVTIGSALAVADWPVEGRFVHLGSNRILGVARTEETGGNLFQITSSNDGTSWSVSETNISDGHRTPAAIHYDSTADLVTIWYWDRNNGVIRKRQVDPDAIFSSPTSWPAASTVLSGGTTSVADNGYTHSVPHNGGHALAFYAGNSTPERASVHILQV